MRDRYVDCTFIKHMIGNVLQKVVQFHKSFGLQSPTPEEVSGQLMLWQHLMAQIHLKTRQLLFSAEVEKVQLWHPQICSGITPQSAKAGLTNRQSGRLPKILRGHKSSRLTAYQLHLVI